MRPLGSTILGCFLFFLKKLFLFFSNLFFIFDFSLRFFFIFCFFVLFQLLLHSGRSKVTRVTVGRDTDQPKFTSL